jgi:predicted nuclease of predicted toxin-antitoxin system
MTIALYMDENIDGPISDQLVQRGIDVLTAQQDGRSGWADEFLLARAYELRRVLVTKDSDYFAEATKVNEAGGDHYGILYLRDQFVPLGVIITDLEYFATGSEPDEVLNTITRIPFPT